MNFEDALVLWRGIGVDYEGGVLDADARTAIQMMHRLFAVVVFGHVLAVGEPGSLEGYPSRLDLFRDDAGAG